MSIDVPHAMRVVGPPRSGTNLVKFLVEVNTPIKCHFNSGWWKHALISPASEGGEDRGVELPTVIMFREPVSQILSFFKLSQLGGKALRGADSLPEFISRPVYTRHADDLVEYRYSSPIDYLIQYYHAALSWSFHAKAYVDLAELRYDPSLLGGFLSSHFGEAASHCAFALPGRYLARNPDVDFALGVEYQPDTTVEVQDEILARLRMQLSASMLDEINDPSLVRLYEQLRSNRLST